MRIVFTLLLYTTLLLLTNQISLANEPLVKYKMMYRIDPTTGQPLREDNPLSDWNPKKEPNKYPNYPQYLYHSFDTPWAGPKGTTVDPNNPDIGNADDCYPDDPNNPIGNILFSGRVISNVDGREINGAVVAVYMGAENTYNEADSGVMDLGGKRFVVGGKDKYGRLTNLYSYAVTNKGEYRVYACNDYKKLSANRLSLLRNINSSQFQNVQQLPENYSASGQDSIYYDYSKTYPKFHLAVICGMSITPDKRSLSPIIGEIYSVVNYNNDYKTPNRPNYMRKAGFDIRVNCNSELPTFQVPMFLEYSSTTNIASCRMDDISPNLLSYIDNVRKPFRNALDTAPGALTAPNTTVLPNINSLPDCPPGDPFCLKNFITASFPVPDRGKNIFDYGSKTILDPNSVNDVIKNQEFIYSSPFLIDRLVDLDDTQIGNVDDFIPTGKSSSKGQIDAKIDMRSSIDDYKFDIDSLRQLYACFTTLNAPEVRSSARYDDLKNNHVNVYPTEKYSYMLNMRIPSCRELWCAQFANPDRTLCALPKTNKFDPVADLKYNSSLEQSYYMRASLGYGPAVTLSKLSQADITKNFLVLAKQLIASDFNPKASFPNAENIASYKPITDIGQIPACFKDNGELVNLNPSGTQSEGAIDYTMSNGSRYTFYSPVPLLSFISIPNVIEIYHSNTGDNYQNLSSLNNRPEFFSEECDVTTGPKRPNNQKFANCRKAVIPGGVYSLSALTLISKMCKDALKNPAPNSGVFDNATSTGTTIDLNNNAPLPYKDIEPGMSRIGTVQSLCLCEPGDTNCTLSRSLNNVYESSPNNNKLLTAPRAAIERAYGNYALGSLVGKADQTEGDNFVGVLCKNEFLDPVGKVANTCLAGNLSNYDGPNGFSLPIQDQVKFVRNDNNLQVRWPFSTAELGTDEAYDYLTFQWESTFTDQVKSRITPYKIEGGGVSNANLNEYKSGGPNVTLDSLQSKWEQCDDSKIERKSSGKKYTGLLPYVSPGGVTYSTRESVEDACEAGTLTVCTTEEKYVCKRNKSLGLDRRSKNISDIEVTKSSSDQETRIRGEKFFKLNDTKSYDEIKVIQNVKKGTLGAVRGRFSFSNAKYDPIPEILNGFRDYSMFGKMPTKDIYCKTPKLTALVDLKVYELDVSGKSYLNVKPSSSLIDNYTAGMHCNSYMPEEMAKCDGPNFQDYMSQVWKDAARASGLTTAQTREYCKAIRCKILCQHMYTEGNFYFYGALEENNPQPQYYCRNLNPINGIEFQANKGDEGCVIDYVSRLQQTYAVPRPANSDLSNLNDRNVLDNIQNRRLTKENYPVYNNNLCDYPVFNNLDNNVNYYNQTDSRGKDISEKGNCTPFMKNQVNKFLQEYNYSGSETLR